MSSNLSRVFSECAVGCARVDSSEGCSEGSIPGADHDLLHHSWRDPNVLWRRSDAFAAHNIPTTAMKSTTSEVRVLPRPAARGKGTVKTLEIGCLANSVRR